MTGAEDADGGVHVGPDVLRVGDPAPDFTLDGERTSLFAVCVLGMLEAFTEAADVQELAS